MWGPGGEAGGGERAGGAPKVLGQVFAVVGLAFPEGWSGVGCLRDAGGWGAGREQASEAARRSGIPESRLLAGQRRAKRSPRLRLPAAAEKSQNFFPLLPARPSSRSSSPLPTAAAAGAARLRLWGLGAAPSSAAGGWLRAGGVPLRGRPPCPRPGPSCLVDPPREEGVGRPGARRAAAARAARTG